MQSPPRVTTSHQRQFTVAAEDLVSLSPGQLDPVFSTPRLVWHVEETALELLGRYVDDDEVSVGVTVDVAESAREDEKPLNGFRSYFAASRQ